MSLTGCRYFTGYKPCGKSADCSEACPHRDIPLVSILVVHLGALGAVVRSTSLLMAIKRKFPSSQITWVTDAPADQILLMNNYIDRVLTTDTTGLLTLRALQFEVGFVIDKSLKASGVLAMTSVDMVYGFVADPQTGAILPATTAASELWNIGLSDSIKFYQNRKTENQLIVESLELGPYVKDEYHVPLTEGEIKAGLKRSQSYRRDPLQPVIGFNTGCSGVIPYKKWTIEFHRQVILQLQAAGYKNIVLLGGKEDRERNEKIAEGLNIYSSPTEMGLRDGLISIESCDIVVTGDSLGMHMAIARKKFVIAWFGPTCAHEIELYGRGVKIASQLACSPCWKRHCKQEKMCYDQVALPEVLQGIEVGTDWWKMQNPYLLSRPPSSEICS